MSLRSAAKGRDLLNRNPLDLIEGDFIAGAVVELGGARPSPEPGDPGRRNGLLLRLLRAVSRYLAAHFPTQRALLQTADTAGADRGRPCSYRRPFSLRGQASGRLCIVDGKALRDARCGVAGIGGHHCKSRPFGHSKVDAPNAVGAYGCMLDRVKKKLCEVPGLALCGRLADGLIVSNLARYLVVH